MYQNQIQRCMLSFLECSDSHSSDDISTLINNTLKNDYNGVEVVGCVSNNARNMTATAKKLNFEHIGCFIHSIQLVIRDALVDCSPQVLKDKLDNQVLAEYPDFDE